MKTLTLATLLSYCLIILAMGHGVVTLGLLPMLLLIYGEGEVAGKIAFLAIIITIGEACLVSTLFAERYSTPLILTGAAFLFVAFIMAIGVVDSGSGRQIMIVSGLPFLFLSVALVVITFQRWFNPPDDVDA